MTPRGPSSPIKGHLDGAFLLHPNAGPALVPSGLAALIIPRILPVSPVVAPCRAGAALRDLVLVQRGQGTRTREASKTT